MKIKNLISKVEKSYDTINLDFSDSKIGDVLTVSPYWIFPRFNKKDLKENNTEWDLIDVSYTPTNEMIRVSLNKYGELVVYDGHHRLYRDICEGKKYIKVKVSDFNTTYSNI